MVLRVQKDRILNPGRVEFLWFLDNHLNPSFSNLGVLTPVDPPSRVRSAVIAVDQAMKVDKAESILVKQVVSLLCLLCLS